MLYSVMAQQEHVQTGVGPIGGIIGLLLGILILASMWRLFTKAGQPGWAVIIPIMSTLVLLRIIGRPWWWILLFLIPIVNVVVLIMVYIDLAKSFGKSVGYAMGLLFLAPIFVPMLAFSSAQYGGPSAGRGTAQTLQNAV